MIKKLIYFLPVLFLLMAIPLYSQELPADSEDDAQGISSMEDASSEEEFLTEDDQFTPVYDENQLYVISGFEFDIKGRTRPNALIYNGEFNTGEELHGQEELDHYIQDKTQMLINQRVLKDNVALDYSIGEQQEDGSCPVIVIIKVEDSWNVIALPRPSYKSDSGFDLTIKARDYNFLGTMNPLRVDLGYKYDENKRHSADFLIDSNTFFNAFGYNWNFNFDNLFRYRPQVDEPYYYQNITGLSMELPFRNTTFTFGFEESFNYGEENEDRYLLFYDEEFQHGLYMASRLYTTWEIPTGLMVSRFGELTYVPGISATFNHELAEKWKLLPFRIGPFLGFDHSLGFEKIDWHSNYREGLSVSVGNSYNLDFYRLNNDLAPLSITVSFTGIGHFILSDFFAVSTRLMYRYWYYHDPDFYDQASNALRGIADKSICADNMLSLNMDFPLRILLFTPSTWIKDTRLFRFFDFELHLSPVIDMALYHTPQSETTTEVSFSPKNIALSGGLELVFFPLSFRSLYIRFGYAMNLREFMTARPVKLPDGVNREIYLIMGHFY